MNERILELEKQCYRYAGFRDDTIVFDKQKFADLIVKECARVASDFVRGPGGDHGVRQAVQEHFGIK